MASRSEDKFDKQDLEKGAASWSSGGLSVCLPYPSSSICHRQHQAFSGIPRAAALSESHQTCSQGHEGQTFQDHISDTWPTKAATFYLLLAIWYIKKFDFRLSGPFFAELQENRLL